MERKITQTDLNLAINYMVIERIIKCTGVDKYLYDEYDWLEVVFKKAANGTLNNMFKEFANQPEGIETIVGILENIFGLDHDVLLGERQIDLGIEVDPTKTEAVKLSKMRINELEEYIEKRVQTPGDAYDEMPWLNNGEIIEKIHEALTEQIGSISLLKNKELYEALKKFSSNPLGLNTLGLFVFLIGENKLDWSKIDVNQGKTPNWRGLNVSKAEVEGDKERELFHKIFETFKYTPKKANVSMYKDDHFESQEAELDYTTSWKSNIYCLDSLIFYIIKQISAFLLGSKGRNESELNILESYSILLPYPLVFKTPSNLEQLKGNNAHSEVGDVVDFSSLSDLAKIFNTILKPNTTLGDDTVATNSYIFDFKYTQLVEYSSIEEEEKHYVEDIIPELKLRYVSMLEQLNRRQFPEEYEDTDQGIESNEPYEKKYARFDKVGEELKYIQEVYLPELEASQALFNANKGVWLTAQLARINSQTISQALIDEEVRIVTAMYKKGKAWIRVREPYYDYISINK